MSRQSKSVPFAPDPAQIDLILRSLERAGTRILANLVAGAEQFQATAAAGHALYTDPHSITPASDVANDLTDTELTESPVDANYTLLPIIDGLAGIESQREYTTPSRRYCSLSVWFGRELEAETDPNELGYARRLLKTILVGDGSRAGIKSLSDIGDNIVQVQGVFRSHRRLIGCFDPSTRRLVLLYLWEMPDDRAGYFRILAPYRNMCSEHLSF